MAAGGDDAYTIAKRLANAGPRPAAGRREARAHALVKRSFTKAGLRVVVQRFRVPGKGGSRNVIGVYDTPARCLRIVMAHTDSTPGAPGANDNASGVGVVTELAGRMRAIEPACDVWLVATGAEERIYTGSPDHLGALALAARLRAIEPACDVWLVATGAEERLYTGSPDHLGALALARKTRGRRLRWALSLDEVGRGPSYWLRSGARGARRGVEGELLTAARRAKARVRWVRDDGTGNSDHREFQLAGMPAAKLGVAGRGEPCRHMPCDRAGRLQPRSLKRVRILVERALRIR